MNIATSCTTSANNDNVRLFKTGTARFQTGISRAYLIIL